MNRFDEAEIKLRGLIELRPDAVPAYRLLAKLMNHQGLRQQANELVYELLAIGNVTQQELHSLIGKVDAFEGFPDRQTEVATHPESMPVLAASRLEFSDGNFKRALSLLNTASLNEELSSEGSAFLGRLAVELADGRAMRTWTESDGFNDDQKRFSDYWVATGTVLLNHPTPSNGSSNTDRDSINDTVSQAAHAFIQSLLIDPSDWIAMSRLETCLDRLGHERLPDIHSQVTFLRKTILLSNEVSSSSEPSIATLGKLAETLTRLGRVNEAFAWKSIALAQSGATKTDFAQLNQERGEQMRKLDGRSIDHAQLLQNLNPATFDEPQTKDIAAFALATSSGDQFGGSADQAYRDTEQPRTASSELAVKASPLPFSYQNADPHKWQDLQIYEQFGGAVAVLDYNLDGHADIALGQGGSSLTQDSVGGGMNSLLSQVDGKLVQKSQCGLSSVSYTMGMTAGDWNQDGFADLIIANFGRNELYLNQGDGTFRQSFPEIFERSESWTSSIALADVDQDQIPDLIEVNYIDDPRVFDITKKGPDGRFEKFLGPESYRPAPDFVHTRQGDGTWNTVQLGGDKSEAVHGLGLVITDIDSDTQNEIFVANDSDPNQLWELSTRNDVGPDASVEPIFEDYAKILGCAYSSTGGSAASMGIATGDFDRDGFLDLQVTNFLNEPIHLYMQNGGKQFRDEVIPSGLYKPSMSTLGFGTEAIDFENDGALDIICLNGHIDDMEFRGAPHRMKPQAFLNKGSAFSSPEPSLPVFFRQPKISRGLARVDFNNDGLTDFVATHHGEPAELVLNQTNTGNHWIQLRCIGVSSERDSIGARVAVVSEGRTLMDAVTTGDGYSCKNEPVLSFGLGRYQNVDTATITWPSGNVQKFDDVKADHRYLAIENQPTLWRTSRD